MPFEEFIELVRGIFPDLSEAQVEQFRRLEALYRDWNAKINVVSRKDIDEIYRHHILHSLMIAAFLKTQRTEIFEAWTKGEMNGKKLEILDLGTGGGFPGIPLAILFPKVHFTLCDSIGKKITVAREVAAGADVKNVTTVNARAESLDQTFDFVVSRAVTALSNFLPWVKGKYKTSILYLKGGNLNEEIAEAMGKFKMPSKSVATWRIDSILDDDFFVGKFVIEITSSKLA